MAPTKEEEKKWYQQHLGTHIMKDKKDENIDEFPMSFPIRVICSMIDKTFSLAKASQIQGSSFQYII